MHSTKKSKEERAYSVDILIFITETVSALLDNGKRQGSICVVKEIGARTHHNLSTLQKRQKAE
jgi:hypothetical protein